MTQGKAPRERPAPMPAANRPTRHAIRRSRHGYNPGITQKPERYEITTRPELFQTAAPAGRGSAATDDPAGRVPQRQTASQRGGAIQRTEHLAQHPAAGHQPAGVRRAAHPQERIRDDRGAPERDEQRPQLDEFFAGDARTGHGRAEFRTAHQPPRLPSFSMPRKEPGCCAWSACADVRTCRSSISSPISTPRSR